MHFFKTKIFLIFTMPLPEDESSVSKHMEGIKIKNLNINVENGAFSLFIS